MSLKHLFGLLITCLYRGFGTAVALEKQFQSLQKNWRTKTIIMNKVEWLSVWRIIVFLRKQQNTSHCLRNSWELNLSWCSTWSLFLWCYGSDLRHPQPGTRICHRICTLSSKYCVIFEKYCQAVWWMLSGVCPGETKTSVLSPGRWADGRGSNSPVTHRRSSTASIKSEQRIEDFWLDQKFLGCLPFPIPPAPKTGGQLMRRGFFPGKEKLNISL